MYIMHTVPWKSKGWVAPEGELLGETDRAFLTPGARDIRKTRTADEDAAGETRDEHVAS